MIWKYENEDTFSPLSSHLNLDRPAAAKENSGQRLATQRDTARIWAQGRNARRFPILCLFNMTQLHIYIFTGCCLLEPGSRTVRWSSGSWESLRVIVIVVVLFTAGLQRWPYLYFKEFGPTLPNDGRLLSRGRQRNKDCWCFSTCVKVLIFHHCSAQLCRVPNTDWPCSSHRSRPAEASRLLHAHLGSE